MNTHSEKGKVFLVCLPYTVVNPRTMMVHLLYTATTNTVKPDHDNILTECKKCAEKLKNVLSIPASLAELISQVKSTFRYMTCETRTLVL